MERANKPMNFGQRLAYSRNKKGLTQQQLAELAGSCQCSIYRFETGKQKPSAAMIRKITTALEVPADWFENDDNFSMAEKQLSIDADNRKAFGQRLAYSRNEKGLTQKQLAELTGVCKESINRLETGRHNPSAATIQKITTALEVQEDWFENSDNFRMVGKQQAHELTKEQRRTLGQRLGHVRKKRGLQQKQLAELIGVKRDMISGWETGWNTPSAAMIREVAKALEVPEDWLENGDNFSIAENQQACELTKEQRRTLGRRLGYVRKKRGLQQKQLAEIIGVKCDMISRWETGWNPPSAAMIREIEKALEVPEDWLLNDDNFSTGYFIDNREERKLTKEQQQLVLDNEHIIYCVLKKLYLTRFKDEIWDIGQIGLCKAARSWEKEKRIPFFTVAFNYIQAEYLTEHRKESKDVKSNASLDYPINDDAIPETFGALVPDPNDYFEQIEYKILAESVYQRVEHVLSPREKTAFKLWLIGNNSNDIAREIGVSIKRASELTNHAKKKCRTLFSPDELFS